MPRSIAATLVIALPLAGLFSLSGAVSLGVAAAAMIVFVFIVLCAGRLGLRAANCADMPLAAAWVLGVFATAIALFALVMALHLLAATAFAIWAVVILALSVFFREQTRPNWVELIPLALCAAATLYWCASTAEAPAVLAREGVLPVWVDHYIHATKISQFGDPRAMGGQAMDVSGMPRPLYHYASYLLPAVFAWPLDLPGLPLATSVWLPIGFFTLCAGIYVLGNSLAGALGGLLSLALLTALPDAGTYGLHNLGFGYYWYVLAVPGACYGVGVALVSIALLKRWAERPALPALAASAALVLGSALIRVQIFLLAAPAWVASAAMLEPYVRRRKVVFLGAAVAAYGVFVFAYYTIFPNAVYALPVFLEISHHHMHQLNQPVYQSWYNELAASHAPLLAVTLGVLLVFPAALGIFVVLYPLSVWLMHRIRGLAPIDFVPVALLGCWLLLILSAPTPPSGDATELTQRPFVLVYAVLAVWTAAGFALWASDRGGLRARRVRLAMVVVAALWVAGTLFLTVADARWGHRLKAHRVPSGLVEAARFVRSNSQPGDVLAVPGLSPAPSYTDPAIQLVSLTGIPAYLSRPLVQGNRSPAAREIARQRYEELARVADESDMDAALARLHNMGVRWYVATENPRWDAQRKHAAFAAAQTAVYRVP